MEVLVIHRLERMSYDVYVKIGEDREARTTLFLTPEGTLLVGAGQETPKWLTIPEDIFEAMIDEGRKHFPPEKDDVREHLSDTIGVRDRLLKLIEIQSERASALPAVIHPES